MQELKQRLLVTQALEAARTVEEGVITDPREADVGSILGFGFAPYTGGALSYIDFMGAKAFVALCERLAGEARRALRAAADPARHGGVRRHVLRRARGEAGGLSPPPPCRRPLAARDLRRSSLWRKVAMARTIDYYYSLVSPWAYIGHAPFMAMAARARLSVNHKPVFLGRVFAETGGLPLAQRHPARQRYRLARTAALAREAGLGFNLQPEALALRRQPRRPLRRSRSASHKDPDGFLRRAFAAIWEEERNLGDPLVIAEIAEAAGSIRPPSWRSRRDD